LGPGLDEHKEMHKKLKTRGYSFFLSLRIL